MPAKYTSSERKGAIAACILLVIAAAAVIWSSGAFRPEAEPAVDRAKADVTTVTSIEADSILNSKSDKKKSHKKKHRKRTVKSDKKSGGSAYSRSHRDEIID